MVTIYDSLSRIAGWINQNTVYGMHGQVVGTTAGNTICDPYGQEVGSVVGSTIFNRFGTEVAHLSGSQVMCGGRTYGSVYGADGDYRVHVLAAAALLFLLP